MRCNLRIFSSSSQEHLAKLNKSIMSGLRVVSRNELFDTTTNVTATDDRVVLPKLDLEFVDVQTQQEDNIKSDRNDESDVNNSAEEFEFPLFSFGTITDSTTPANDVGESVQTDENRGRKATALIKVSLREPSPDSAPIGRARTYYCAEYSEQDRHNFSAAAVSADVILKYAELGPYPGWLQFRGKVIDVDEHNRKVHTEQVRIRHLRRKRPGKRQRMARLHGKEREDLRKQRDSEIKKLLKKKFHKRGGKKNKKKATNPLADAGAISKAKAKP
ncbi:uncharacterized protein KLLA0_F03707g [Kluyveromyces lactis]|uniref:KLLA0F03707p n=1 Tax=Kluyveromyces lactis (strain ATCC 8585 / CBS 2359 / DSM 70799 / NBRC 1267 / NRRL Y-1140 / WM37) TaxID=284590 RepID=Q6CLE1_KLULA|nr:uncharacterized protein KLLA0_F03707g [Kluyveromyces lactis]CAG97956.1 KLLA0F03707p [Kluyveromyces lactis]|eukprot:XP_455248.1 uncharacterized protein KLLA0_F03707g [Kluyveromyces lactis]